MTTGQLSHYISNKKRKKYYIEKSKQYYKNHKEEITKKDTDRRRYKAKKVKELRDKFCKMKSTKGLCELIKILFRE